MSTFKKIFTTNISSVSNSNIYISPDGSGEVILKGNPTNDLGAAPKQYVDTASSASLNVLDSVVLKTVSLLPSYTQSGTGIGATLTADSNGDINNTGIDNVVGIINGDRVLIDTYGTTDDSHNGIYVFTSIGSVSTPWVLTRSTDADTNDKLKKNTYVFVTDGTTSANSGWIVKDLSDLDVLPLNWVQFSASTDYIINNIGVGIGEIFKNKVGNNLNFKTIESVSNIITISNNTDEISINTIPTNIVSVGALDSGSITSNFGNITIPTSNIFCNTLNLNDTSTTFGLNLISTSNIMTDNRSLIFDVKDSNKTITLGGSITLADSLSTTGSFPLTLTQTSSTNVTLPTSGTLSTLTNPETFTNKILTDSSNIITSNNLRTSTASINIDSNTPLSTYIMVANSPTVAVWEKNKGALGILPVVTITTSTYNILPTDCIISCKYSLTGKQTITLPSASTIDLGKTYHIVDADGNANINEIVINSIGGTINGSVSAIINTDNQSISVYTDGVNWFIM